MEDDGEYSGDVLAVGGFTPELEGFRDASEDRRDDGEEHDSDSDRSVDGVSQGATPQTDRRGVNHDDHGCTGYSKLEEKGETRRSKHRPECSWRKHASTFRERRGEVMGERPPFLLETGETNPITEHFPGNPPYSQHRICQRL